MKLNKDISRRRKKRKLKIKKLINYLKSIKIRKINKSMLRKIRFKLKEKIE